MKFFKSFSIIFLITILTQLLMLIKNMWMAKIFGVSAIMDAFNLANIFTVSIIAIISAAITTVLIPLLSNKNNSIEEKESINTYVTIIFLFSMVVFLGFLIFGRPFISLFTSSMNDQMEIITFNLTIILAFSQIFKVYTGIGTAFLQTREDFISPKLATFIASVIGISYFFIFQKPTIYGITIVLGISFIIEAAFLYVKQKRMKINIKFSFKLKNPTFKMLIKNTLPIIISSAVFQFSLIFSNFISSYYGEGYVSILGYSNQIVNIFHGLIILNIIMMLYPKLASKFNEDIKEGKRNLINYINLTNMAVIPIVFGFLAIGDLIVKVLFERGNFTSENTNQVFLMSSILFLAFPMNTFRDYIYRSFYSINDTKTPSRNSIIIVIITIILIALLTPIFKVYSVVIGPVLASIISLILSYKKLINRIGTIDYNKQILKKHICFILSSIIMFIVVFLTRKCLDQFNLSALINLVILFPIGILVYIVMTYFMQKNFLISIIKNRSYF